MLSIDPITNSHNSLLAAGNCMINSWNSSMKGGTTITNVKLNIVKSPRRHINNAIGLGIDLFERSFSTNVQIAIARTTAANIWMITSLRLQRSIPAEINEVNESQWENFTLFIPLYFS